MQHARCHTPRARLNTEYWILSIEYSDWEADSGARRDVDMDEARRDATRSWHERGSELKRRGFRVTLSLGFRRAFPFSSFSAIPRAAISASRPIVFSSLVQALYGRSPCMTYYIISGF